MDTPKGDKQQQFQGYTLSGALPTHEIIDALTSYMKAVFLYKDISQKTKFPYAF